MNSKSVNVEEREIFLGFKAYTESDADIFKGRSQDTEYLYDLVANKDYVLCYAESGEGKSSLIDAGLTPRLRANRYFPVKISFTDDDFNDNDINFDSLIKSRIIEAINNYQTADNGQMLQSMLSFQPKSDSIFNEKYSDDLWWFLRNNTLSLYGMPLTLVMIFDQFEEVLNYPKSNVWTNRFFAFLEKISSDNCPQYILDDIDKTLETCEDVEFPDIMTKKNFKAVFSIRTEYIGELDYWCMQRYFIPDLKHNRFCLKALTMQGADEIMRQYEGFDDELCDNIKAIIVKEFKNTTSNVQNVMDNCVSALILSVVCTSLYNNREKILTKSFITDSIENFYNDIIAKCNISIEERNVIASVLVDKDKRVRVASDCSALEKIGFNKKYKDALLQNRLIKKSSANGVEYIELVHDSLIDIVKKHKEEALQKELRTRRRNMTIFSFLLSIVLILVFLILGFKKNEKNYLITQAKFIAAEAEKLVEDNNIFDAVRLVNYVAINNKESLDVQEFECVAREINSLLSRVIRNYKNGSIPVKGVAFSPNNNHFITHNFGMSRRELYLYSLNGKYVKMYTKNYNDRFLTQYQFSNEGQYALIRIDEDKAALWSVDKMECITKDIRHSYDIQPAFSDNDEYILLHSNDTIFIYSINDDMSKPLYKHKDVNELKFVKNDSLVLTSSHEMISLLDFRKDTNVQLLPVNKLLKGKYINEYYIKFNKDLISVYKTHEICKVSYDNLSETQLDSIKCYYYILPQDDGLSVRSQDNIFLVTEVEYTPNMNLSVMMNDEYILIRDDLTKYRCYSLIDKNKTFEINHDEAILSAIFSDDGKYVLTASRDNTAKLHLLSGRKCVQVFPHKEDVYSAVFAPDGKSILTACGDGSTKLWEMNSDLDTLITILNQYDNIDTILFRFRNVFGNLDLTKEEKVKYNFN